MRHEPIGKRRLYELLCAAPAGQWITLTAVTSPRMRSPFNNLYTKVARVKVKIKVNYSRSVNAQKAREGKTPNFKAHALTWGVWENPNSPFIKLGKQLFLRVQKYKVLEEYYLSATGERLEYEEVRYLFRQHKEGKRQGVKKKVVCRTFHFDTLRRVSIGGRHYRRKGLGLPH